MWVGSVFLCGGAGENLMELSCPVKGQEGL